MRRYLAVDCGGSHTSALLLGEGGRLIDSRQSGPANLAVMGPGGVAQRVAELLNELPADSLALAVAGLRGDEDRGALLSALARAGLSVRVALFPDVRAALRAAGLVAGVVLIAGTGSAALAVDKDGEEKRAGGWGRLLGDEGSGFWIGREALSSVVRAADEGDPTAAGLTGPVLRELDLPDAISLRALTRRAEAVVDLLPAVAAAYAEGNAEAARIARDAAAELARLVRLAAQDMNVGSPIPVVLAGGVFRGFPAMAGLVQSALGAEFETSLLQVDPAWGAYWLAIEHDRWENLAQAAESPTEAVSAASEALDRLDILGVLRLINEEDAKVAPAVRRCLPAIARVVDAASERLARGGRLIYVGAGTSGRLAMLDAVECVPTFGTSRDEVTALVAGGNEAMTRAVEGAEDDAGAGRRSIEELDVSEADVVIGISASGGAPYVRAAVRSARRRGAFTAALTCHPGSELARLAEVPIAVEVGPEIIAGSTRLKCGTAQKLVLNMISTTVMIRRGRTLGGRMVSLRPSNEKLRRRALRLVSELTGSNADEAHQALERAGWDVGMAALTLRLGNREAAEAALAASGGNINRALQESGLDAAGQPFGRSSGRD